MNNIIFCDIDGTITSTYFIPQNRIKSKEQLNNIKDNIEKLKLSTPIIATLHTISKYSKLIFLTGRPKEWREITYNFLNPINREFEVYFPNFKGEWTKIKYYDFKLRIINNVSKDYDFIVVIDDIMELLEYIKKYFKWEKKPLLLINAKYNQFIEDMVVVNRLL